MYYNMEKYFSPLNPRRIAHAGILMMTYAQHKYFLVAGGPKRTTPSPVLAIYDHSQSINTIPVQLHRNDLTLTLFYLEITEW